MVAPSVSAGLMSAISLPVDPRILICASKLAERNAGLRENVADPEFAQNAKISTSVGVSMTPVTGEPLERGVPVLVVLPWSSPRSGRALLCITT